MELQTIFTIKLAPIIARVFTFTEILISSNSFELLSSVLLQQRTGLCLALVARQA